MVSIQNQQLDFGTAKLEGILQTFDVHYNFPLLWLSKEMSWECSSSSDSQNQD